MTQPPSEFLYAANQNGITAFPLNASTGGLGAGSLATSVLAASGVLANMVSDSAGKFLFACSLYSSSTEAFSINSKSGALTPISGSTLPIPGVGACNLSIDATGKFLYIASSAGVSAFTVNATTGALSAVAGSLFSDGSVLRESVSDPSGKFLYAISNTTLNTISVFAINSSNGALTPVAGSPFQADRRHRVQPGSPSLRKIPLRQFPPDRANRSLECQLLDWRVNHCSRVAIC